MQKTLEVLDLLHERIVRLRNVLEQEGTLLSDESVNAFNALRFDLEDAENDKQISKQMADKYSKLIDDFRHGPNEVIQELLKLNNNYEQDVEAADKKLEKSIGVVGDAMQWQDDNDDKTVLAEVQNLMGVFEQSYNDKGVLDSVDALCKVGDAIKKGLEEKKISRKTAEELMKPLVEIKDNMFDEQLCADKMRECNENLQQVLSKDGKEKSGKESKTDEKFTLKAKSVVGRLVEGAVKGQKTIAQKIDAKAKAKADKLGVKPVNSGLEKPKDKTSKVGLLHAGRAVQSIKKEKNMTARDIKQKPDENRKLESDIKRDDMKNTKAQKFNVGMERVKDIDAKDKEQRLLLFKKKGLGRI